MNPTDKQKAAIDARGSNLLVSAAAGSGKTSVLTQRIAALVEEGADIRRMLICTFTNAAAQEMRLRISDELSDRAEKTGELRLRAQSECVYAADICTIHKFAIKVTKENFLKLGIPQNMRIGSSEECMVLFGKAYKSIVSGLNAAKDQNFKRILARYGGKSGAMLKESIFELYSFIESRPERLKWLDFACEASIDKYLEYIEERRRELLDGLYELSEKSLSISELVGTEKQIDNDENQLNIVKKLTELYNDNIQQFESLICELNVKDVIPNLQRGMSEHLKSNKELARKYFKQLKDMPNIQDTVSRELIELQTDIIAISSLVKALDTEYANLKLERRMMSFDDVQHYAYTALLDDELAEKYKQKYDYIFIDEYQDTNPLQDALLRRISKGDNMFMVGDMKQSIYRFRLADPLIFRNKAAEYEKTKDLLIMNENFRSFSGVTNAVNAVMSNVMSRKLGELEYSKNEELIPKRGNGGSAEIIITENSAEEDIPEAEAVTVAKRILELIEDNIIAKNGELRKTEYSDICVLTRKRYPYYASVFKKYGIPFVIDKESHETSPEIEIFVNFLRLADSITSDIALISCLRWMGFDERELALIRCIDKTKDTPFIQAFLKACTLETELGEKCADFHMLIKRFRLYSKTMTVPETILTIKSELDFDAVAAALPGNRGDDFNTFIDFCINAPEHALESLFAFITFLDDLKRDKGTIMPDVDKDMSSINAVRLMTVHGSKGLEFPIVIYAGTGHAFNINDLKNRLIIHSDFGITADIINERTGICSKSQIREIVKDVIKRENISEELRILYVALTRAQEKLIISGLADDAEELLNYARQAETPIVMNSVLKWILYANERTNAFKTVVCKAHEPDPPKRNESSSIVQNTGERIEFFEFNTMRIPSKVSVSSLKPEFEFNENVFAQKINSEFSGAQIGTLIHSVLEYINFDCRTEEQVIATVDTMHSKLLFTDEEAEIVKKNAHMIARFLISDIAYRARRSSKMWRELPFSLSVKARDINIADSDDTVMVQGIIDLVFEEGGGLVIVDYKTDRVNDNNIGDIIDRYDIQLRMYERAISTITDMPVKTKYLYLMRAGYGIEVMG